MERSAFYRRGMRLLLPIVVSAGSWSTQAQWTRRAMAREVESFTHVMVLSRNYQGLALDSDGLTNMLVKLIEAHGDWFVTEIKVKFSGFQPAQRTFAADPTGPFSNIAINQFDVSLGQNEYQLSLNILESHWVAVRKILYAVALGLAWLLLSYVFTIWRQKDIDVMRYEERDRVARQVAHDLRSPLTALETGIRYIQSKPQEAQDLLEKALVRVNEIANDVLKPKAGGLEKLIPVHDLWASLVEVLDQVKRSLPENVRIEMRNPSQPLGDRKTRGTSDKWGRIITNLVTNAIEAYDHGREKKVVVELVVTADVLRISVRDFGRGMSNETLARAGEKGFSFGKTDSGSGAGLGLFDAKSTISNWGGHLHIDSAPGSGTMVTIEIPLVG